MGLIGGVANVSVGYAKRVFTESPAILTIKKLEHRYDIYRSCVGMLNKLVFSPSKALYDIDGSYYDFANKLDAKLIDIRRRVVSGNYKFSPYVRKSVRLGHKQRDIYLANWHDKLVERWIACGLNLLLSKWFSNNCYAYRPGKFGLDLCQRMVARACQPDMFIIRRDISNYFYSIPHDKLLAAVSNLLDCQDPLYDLIKQRIFFEHTDGQSEIGVPFGSPIACVLANIYLTELDRNIERLPVKYFRYADDLLIIAYGQIIAEKAEQTINNKVVELGLHYKASHTQNLYISSNHADYFKQATKFKFLGLEFSGSGIVRLGREKQRKIINLFTRELKLLKSKIRKLTLPDRINFVVTTANNVLTDRIRSAAIVDYYLKHVNDVQQLKTLDLLIAQSVISTILGKPFRYRDFNTISYKKLRQAGLVSLVHRHRLHKQGHIKIGFLSLYNKLTIKRYRESIDRRHDRLQQMAMLKKLKRLD